MRIPVGEDIPVTEGHSYSVFHDPSGTRRAKVRLGFFVLFALLGAMITLFLVTLFLVPFLPKLPGISENTKKSLVPEGLSVTTQREPRLRGVLFRRSRKALLKEIRRIATPVPQGKGALPIPPPPQVSIAFYAPWQETGLHSLRANADKITHLMPEWLHLTPDGKGFTTRDWDPLLTPHNADVVQIARAHGVAILPILNNAQEGKFDSAKVHALFSSVPAQRTLIADLAKWLLSQGFAGINLDFENLADEDYQYVPKFLALLRETFVPAHLLVTIDVEAGMRKVPLSRLARYADLVVFMAYDEHYSGGEAGPIASIGWSEEMLLRALQEIPRHKLVLGVGNYAYDWVVGQKGAEAITYQSAILRARDNNDEEKPEDVIELDGDTLNPTYNYVADDGKSHVVWMLDAVSAYNQLLYAMRAQIRGVALWMLGSEDPGIWQLLSRFPLSQVPAPGVLEKISFPYEIDFEGDGEILSVRSVPHEGSRAVVVSPETGLITQARYKDFPSSYLIQRTGYQPKQIVLSFDDGPDPEYTSDILQVLRENQVHATFFVIGKSAQEYPRLLRQIWQEGHEIGNHSFTHPNLAAMNENRRVLELNTTQRAIESIIGRSTLLFRPPYNADAEPVSAEEVIPIVSATALNYLTVGTLIDPQDWNLVKLDGDGREVPRTAEDIAKAIIEGAQKNDGNIVLLHDGGGDRSLTVEGVKIAIPTLKAAGYRFVTVGDLIGKSRDVLMPPLRAEEGLLVGFDRLMFDLIFSLERVLRCAFIVALVLGIGRILFVVPLALIADRRQRGQPSQRSPTTPRVSVAIAAYNEEKTIERTLVSALASTYPVDEILVVDDGSSDGTASVVRNIAAGDARVRLISQPNSGKARALNRAYAECRGEIVVCIDADTQLEREAIAHLVEPFHDRRVAAVAGNVKVGNRENLITKWQSLEYITSQNLDRRAYAWLNAITVVPGAIGAWRAAVVNQVGGYLFDTLAEDMDLSWRIRRAGYRLVTANGALGFTEAPASITAFLTQRMRWAFGTLQCLWKHRDALGRYGWFGGFALPSLWLFQVFFNLLAPIIDLQILYSFALFVREWLSSGVHTQDWQPLLMAQESLWRLGYFYALFFVVELIGAIIALRLDGEAVVQAHWVFLQRFFYRQLLYIVAWRSVARALGGMRQGWSKLQRRGTVTVQEGP